MEQAFRAYALGAGYETVLVNVENGLGLVAAIKEVKDVAIHAVGCGPVAVCRAAVRRQAAKKAKDNGPALARSKPAFAGFKKGLRRGQGLAWAGKRRLNVQRKGAGLNAEQVVNQRDVVCLLVKHGAKGLGFRGKAHQGFIENVASLEHANAVEQAQSVQHRVNGAKSVQLALVERLEHCGSALTPQ